MDSSRGKKELSIYFLLMLGTVLGIRSYYGGNLGFPQKETETSSQNQSVTETEASLQNQSVTETEASSHNQSVTEAEALPEKESTAENGVFPGEEIVFWYYGSENRDFFESMADEFKSETGIAVKAEEQQSYGYFSKIYEASKTGEEDMPDVYLLSSEQLDQAYYCQLLSENRYDLPKDCAEMAREASGFSEDGKLYGYPLYFNTSVFAYRTDYFETAPGSIQEIIDYSVEHEPGDGVEKLLEWDLGDAGFNFAFLGSGITFSKEEGCISPEYQEEVFESCREFFGNLTAVIALEEDAISSRKVWDDFVKGKTVAVLLPSDELKSLGKNCETALMPKLNEELNMCPISDTSMICVNDMTEKNDGAQAFASFLSSLSPEEKLRDMTGHMPVVEGALEGELEETCFLQYENGRAKPSGLNVTDFWVKFQSQALKVWHEAE